MINNYTIDDTILSSVNVFCNDVNNKLFDKMDVLKCKYNTTTSKYAKNQTVILNKDVYDASKQSLNFCSTIHLIQGLTLKNKIYINPNNLFIENLLYVAFSRAINIDQIYIIEN